MATNNQAKLIRKVYRFLVMKAQCRQTATYEEIALQFQEYGLYTSGSALGATLAPILGAILDWCKQRGQPPLTSIVVRKSGADKGIPGQGFWDMLVVRGTNKRDLTDMFHQQVFDYYEM